MNRFQVIISVLFIFFAQSILAGDILEFTQKSFDEAQKSDKSILLEFHADWCSTCIRQKANLETLVKEKKIKDILVYHVNFDNEVDLKNAIKVQRQSTLVLLKGYKEIRRTIGTTDLEQIRSFINKD